MSLNYNEETQYKLGVTGYEQMGGKDIGLGLGEIINLRKSGNSVEDIFKTIAVATINRMNNNTRVLSDDGLVRMTNGMKKIPLYEFKNPSAYAMGFVVAIATKGGGTDLDLKKLNMVFRINSEIEDELETKIDKTDIIRYARMCLLNKIK
jgi:hypothetical protein